MRKFKAAVPPAAVAGLSLLLPALMLAGEPYSGTFPPSGAGAIEFTVTPQTSSFPFGKNIVLLRAASSDGKETYEVHVNAEDLLVLRDFGPCVRSANRTPHNFKKDVPYRLRLAWNQQTTKFYINGKEVEGFDLMAVDDYRKMQPHMNISSNEKFEIGNIRVSADSGISVAAADRAFVEQNACPNIAELYKIKPQEEYRGVGLVNFQNAAAKAEIKKYLDALPAAAVADVKRVIFMDSARYAASPWRGQAQLQGGVIFMQGDSIGPAVFFHEAAHIYDYANLEPHGVMLSQTWEKKFMQGDLPGKGPRDSSVLNRMDASTALEQFADFSGAAYAAYLSDKPDAVSNMMHWQDAGPKLDFLLETGYISREMRAKFRSEK